MSYSFELLGLLTLISPSVFAKIIVSICSGVHASNSRRSSEAFPVLQKSLALANRKFAIGFLNCLH